MAGPHADRGSWHGRGTKRVAGRQSSHRQGSSSPMPLRRVLRTWLVSTVSLVTMVTLFGVGPALATPASAVRAPATAKAPKAALVPQQVAPVTTIAGRRTHTAALKDA